MAERENATPLGRVAAAAAFVLPVLGGFLGVVWVNLHRAEQRNPLIALAVGVALGWLAARLLERLLARLRERRR